MLRAGRGAVRVAAGHVSRDGDDALEDEARALRRELQMSVEAFEATTEELKASDQEVTSINEELQSTNEELQTSKEELQSLNEELTTVNCARKHAEQAIATAQQRLQAVIEQMPAAMLMVDAPTGTLLYANRRAASLFNQPIPLPFIGQSWTFSFAAFRGLHADGRPYQPQEWPLARALATGEVTHDEEMGVLAPDGIPGTVSMSISVVHDAVCQPVAFVAAFWDISERKRSEQALRESEERFRLLVESARDVASGARQLL